MNSGTRELFDQLWPVLLSVFGVLAGGAGLRRLLSKDAVARAKDSVESEIYGTAMAEVRVDRDAWRASAEEAWAKVRALEVEIAVQKMEYKLLRNQIKLHDALVKRYPEMAARSIVFDPSGPGTLDSRPVEYVQPISDDKTG